MSEANDEPIDNEGWPDGTDDPFPLPTEEEVRRLREKHPEYFPGPDCVPYSRMLPGVEKNLFSDSDLAHIEGCAYCARTRRGLAGKLLKHLGPAALPALRPDAPEGRCVALATRAGPSEREGLFELRADGEARLLGRVEVPADA
ncbi:MAG: hypothetical protein K2W96_22990, partial [Gemmataceae bacterium]|nr:hypothetical protein [Gemmataceae bacterium]